MKTATRRATDECLPQWYRDAICMTANLTSTNLHAVCKSIGLEAKDAYTVYYYRRHYWKWDPGSHMWHKRADSEYPNTPRPKRINKLKRFKRNDQAS